MSIYFGSNQLTRQQIAQYEVIKDKYFLQRDNLKLLEDERKALTNYFETRT